MKECRKCHNTKNEEEFRKHRAVCRECEIKKAIKYYYTQKQQNPNFLKLHAERERAIRRTENGCKRGLYNRAKSRAKRFKLDFNITLNDIIVPKICPILGMPLMVSEKMSDCSPSLDRINCTQGYIKGNIQVISAKANTIKSNASLEEIEKVFNYMKNRRA
jgi:hypothetical protein